VKLFGLGFGRVRGAKDLIWYGFCRVFGLFWRWNRLFSIASWGSFRAFFILMAKERFHVASVAHKSSFLHSSARRRKKGAKSDSRRLDWLVRFCLAKFRVTHSSKTRKATARIVCQRGGCGLRNPAKRTGEIHRTGRRDTPRSSSKSARG
jgi:hypothetical protein